MCRQPTRQGSDMAVADKQGFNLSRWAIEHAALTRYLMVVLMVLGLASYFQLGQDEDPPFTFRAMVVRAYWPGATAQPSPSLHGRFSLHGRLRDDSSSSGSGCKKACTVKGSSCCDHTASSSTCACFR